MESKKTTTHIQEIAQMLPNIKDKIEETTNEFYNYLEYLKEEKFIEIPNEKEENAIKRAESMFDRLDEIVKRNQIVLKNGKETIELIDIMKLRIEGVIKSCGNDGAHLVESNNGLIDKILGLEERKMKNEIEPLINQINFIKQRFNNKKNEWNNQRLNYDEFKRKNEEEEWKKQPTNQIISFEEMKQLEEWTKMKMGNVIFDSNIFNWNVKTSVLPDKVLNKSNLIFLIEDENGNKFGGCRNSEIVDLLSYSFDPKSFLFSLKSNGRLNGMLKFDVVDSNGPKLIHPRSHLSEDLLFSFGRTYDICIFKEFSKNNSICKQKYFDYNGIENALCGKQEFTPKRIVFIQMDPQ